MRYRCDKGGQASSVRKTGLSTDGLGGAEKRGGCNEREREGKGKERREGRGEETGEERERREERERSGGRREERRTSYTFIYLYIASYTPKYLHISS